MRLRPLLALHFPELAPTRLPGGFDRVGDIAVVSVVPELISRAAALGAVLLAHLPEIRVVARRDGEHTGIHRTRPLEVIAGEKRLTTVHRENGITLHLDLAQVYFSVRLAHERTRVAGLVRPGERVAVLGAGVGPFPLVIGRSSQAAEVVGIECNPVAHAYALKNLRANRQITTVRCLEGDAGQVLSQLQAPFDRLLLPLPHGGEALLPAALTALRPGGSLHLYAMQEDATPQATTLLLEAACHRLQRRPLQITTHLCGHCGPGRHRICLQARIEAAP